MVSSHLGTIKNINKFLNLVKILNKILDQNQNKDPKVIRNWWKTAVKVKFKLL